MKKRITQDDYIKANRKASREAEIEMYGHPICHKRVHQSKKVYNRKKIRRCVKMRTFFFLSTKPQLSQAGALLLPKDFVSLGIRFSL
ncbi:hypothetical protein [Bacteroides caccae]|uniref:Uncharacterized protein n=1 Tax=Bacteroides caccae TaxID=47678 RepID=A0A6A1JU21_9BACE|nr:hypothetical protein [Bacteroides caccae]KAA5476942.1 hypothetical protein F2Y27_18785 [Bacteroides caccae]KAA5484977.1 hypothetical protein F2Y25_20070 [Bacteroides caccae]KAA5488278.1 hypothetical protein F2Y35_19000 [Bacteroides caccae]KAA5498128.1 hypothetical protein F2Y47_21560 [Bacteroides caccae]